MNNLEKLAGEVGRVAVGKVSAMAEIHRKQFVARLKHCKIHGHIRATAGMRLHIHIFRAKNLPRSGDRELFRHIHMLAPSIPAFAGIPLCIFVCKSGALCFHYGWACKIFARNQLNVFLLPQFLVAQYLVDIRIHHFHTKVRFHFVNALLVATPLKLGLHKRIYNPFRRLCPGLCRAKTEYICIVVIAGFARRFYISYQCRARTGNLVGGHAHANTRFAYKHPEPVLATGHTSAHGLGKIWIIAGLIARGTIILNNDSFCLEMTLKGFLQLNPSMIRPNSYGCFSVDCFSHRLLFDKWNDRFHTLLDLIPACLIYFQITANRVGDVPAGCRQFLHELTQQKDLFPRLRKESNQIIYMTASQAKNIVHVFNHLQCDQRATLRGNVESHLLHCRH